LPTGGAQLQFDPVLRAGKSGGSGLHADQVGAQVTVEIGYGVLQRRTDAIGGGALNFAIRGRGAGQKRDEKQREQPAQAGGEREVAVAGEASGLGIRLRHNLVGPGKR
jgi:hypothetical protein